MVKNLVGHFPALKPKCMFAILLPECERCDGVCAGNWTRAEKRLNFHVKRRNLAEKLMSHFNVETALASAPKSATKRADREVHMADEAME